MYINIKNKKVILHEYNRHTAHSIASTCSALLMGWGWGYPIQFWLCTPSSLCWGGTLEGVCHPVLAWGYVILSWLGYSSFGTEIPPWKGHGTRHWGTPPPKRTWDQWMEVQDGDWDAPVNRHMSVKTVSSPFFRNAYPS